MLHIWYQRWWNVLNTVPGSVLCVFNCECHEFTITALISNPWFWQVCVVVLISSLCACVFQSRQLESETGTTEEHSLNKEARKWATRVAREHKNIIHYKRVRGTGCTFLLENNIYYKAHTHTHTWTSSVSGKNLLEILLRCKLIIELQMIMSMSHESTKIKQKN